jgi:hypothetical protein
MTEDMQLRGLAPATQQAYLRYVEQLGVLRGTPQVTRHTGLIPDNPCILSCLKRRWIVR